MGEVYRARDTRLDRIVAIKVLPTHLTDDPDRRKRLEREARAAASLNHPHICTLHDIGRQGDTDYFVMEFLEGETLARRLRKGALPLDDVLRFGAQIADALDKAHHNGVIHRDVKPANVFITTEGESKLLDFGLAKVRRPANDATLDVAFAVNTLTAPGSPIGTLAYMSPEQARGEEVDERTDIFSLGALLYEMATGVAPFRGDTPAEIFGAILNSTPVSPSRRDPRLPEELDRIINKALQKEPSKRYRSVSEMASELSALNAKLYPAEVRNALLRPLYAVPAALCILVIVGIGGWLYWRSEKRLWVREQAIPGIAKLLGEDKSLAAFLLLEQAEKYLPADPQIAQIAADNTRVISVSSSPPGATVEIEDYLSPDDSFYHLGVTPLMNVRIPTGYFRWKVSKEGVGEFIAAPVTNQHMNFALDEEKAAPAGMSWVNGQRWGEIIAFVGFVGGYNVPPFYIDRFEVTNRQFQDFVDKGGYEKHEYWTRKFLRDGRELSWDEAQALFRDSTGRPGPSTWEGGHYPQGQDDYPVSGVSWYEAAAYSAFAGKSLPSFAQRYVAAPPDDVSSYIIRESNISLSEVAPVGKFKGLGPYGTYDMAGNVREWILNDASENMNFILGGAWNSQSYLYSNPEALSPFDRSPQNGFRCVQNTAPLAPAITGTIQTLSRDFSKFKPASDEVYRVYKAMYSYGQTPLNAKVEGVVEETPDWREERVTFNAAYNDERMAAYLFLPKKVRAPFQTVVFFPSARVLSIPNSDALGDVKFFDYVIQSGRAVLYPVYKGTYERRTNLTIPDTPTVTEEFTQHFKDLGRSLDYLATRSDIANDKLAYLGVSMGSAEGVIYTALLQDRLRAVIFLDGGYFLYHPPIGADQADFAPRLKKPVLMVNGRYDYVFSLDRAQIPLFQMLGTPAADKSHIVLDTPHDVTGRRPELIQTVLDWLDKYLGRVE
jgi:tRNA A-37 threonylcarbamoyl transferase component Bud32/dienelactone hydrolase